MNVVIVFDYAHVMGGAAKVAIESAIGLAGQGHHVIFFAAVGPVDQALAAAGIEVVCLEQHDLLGDPRRLRAAVRVLWNRLAQHRLRALLARLDVADSVVHVHQWCKALSPSIGAAIAASGLPVVYTLHEYFLACPNGAFFDFREGRNCQRVPLSRACVLRNCDSRHYAHKLWRAARHAVLQASGGFRRCVRQFICISKLQADVMARYLPPGAGRVLLSNPVSVARRPRADVARNQDFVFVGRLSHEKGAYLLAQAARDLGVPVRFIGEGPERARIRQVLPRAEITGWVSAAGVLAALDGARALVFPSLWYEGQPMIVLEARARGLPVIVSDNTSACEQVAHGVTGLHFRSDDAVSLKAALQALGDPALAARMGYAAYDAYWADPPTLDRHVHQLEAIYREAISGREAIGGRQAALGAGRALCCHDQG